MCLPRRRPTTQPANDMTVWRVKVTVTMPFASASILQVWHPQPLRLPQYLLFPALNVAFQRVPIQSQPLRVDRASTPQDGRLTHTARTVAKQVSLCMEVFIARNCRTGLKQQANVACGVLYSQAIPRGETAIPASA